MTREEPRPDRLPQIKASWAEMPHEYAMVSAVYAYEQIAWLVAEVERLTAALQEVVRQKSLSAPKIWRGAQEAIGETDD